MRDKPHAGLVNTATAEDWPKPEFAEIERIKSALAARFPDAGAREVWIGDDSAVLRIEAGQLLLTTDLTVAGVHADLQLMGLDDLGWRAIVAALSDIAAMGGTQGYAVVAVAGPPSTDLELLYAGVGAAAQEHGCPVVGGDLSSCGQLVVCVTAVGKVGNGAEPVLRSGARPGDTVVVTGALGASAAGLRALRLASRASEGDRGLAEEAEEETGNRAAREAGGKAGNGAVIGAVDEALVMAHRRPRARLAAGVAARRAGASAMIDVSDGLAADLWHVADASGVGFVLEEVPVAPGASIDDALGGGEDYELVIAVDDVNRLAGAFGSAGLSEPIVIGTFDEDVQRRTFRGEPLAPLGYGHPWR